MSTLQRATSMSWYHTLELPDDVVTDGIFDLRSVVDEYRLPERLEGMRALEIGTWDGFWAFELERRGAEVVALDLDREEDLDWPARRRPARCRVAAPTGMPLSCTGCPTSGPGRR